MSRRGKEKKKKLSVCLPDDRTMKLIKLSPTLSLPLSDTVFHCVINVFLLEDAFKVYEIYDTWNP